MWKLSPGRDEVSISDNEPSESRLNSIPVASAPSSVTEALGNDSVQSHATSFIGKLLVVKGEVSGEEALVVDGEVEGSIMLRGQRLTVRTNGRVRADIEARHVILHGRVEGDIQATERLELFKSASVKGDVSTGRISIEDGALFNGRLDINKTELGLTSETKPRATAAFPVARASQQPSFLERAAKKAGK